MHNKRKITPSHPASVTALSHDGRGIASINGKKVFISGALPGEDVMFQYKKRRAHFDEGEVTEVISAANDRQTAKCPHFGVCGGCSLQHLKTPQQIAHKQHVLLELLQHQANAQPLKVIAPLHANEWGYRRKARLGVKYVAGKNKVLVGFREKNGRFIANLSRCEVLHPSVGEKITPISDMLYQLTTRDKIPQIEIAVDDQQAALIIRHLVELPAEDITHLKTFAKQHNYKLYFQPKGCDSIHLVHPSDASQYQQYSLDDPLKFDFHPFQFTQVNYEINQLIVTSALELLDVQANDRVLDLFCGIGNFTLPLAKRSKQVVGVEGDASAVEQAQHNARLNRIDNVEFYHSNLFAPLAHEAWSQRPYDKLLLDPPRSGAKEVIESIDVWQPQKIVYISCNPATLARDTGLLLAKGYQLEKAGIANMFAHTQHVEAIALFSKKKGRHS